MRRTQAVLLLVPLVATLPVAPAHDENQVQWDFDCATNEPTSPSLATVRTQVLAATPGELAVSVDRLIVARFNAGGFQIYSLTNPTNPSLVSTFTTAGKALDVKASADGNTVFVGTTSRIHVVSIANPAAPALVRTVTLPVSLDQGHMLYDVTIGGQEYLFAATQSGSGVYIFRVTGAAANRDLVRIAQFAPGSPLAAHDTYVQHDPVLGKPILYVANGFAGWIAADVSDPTLPLPLAVVPNPDAGQGYVHTIQAAWVNGRRLVATIEELGLNILRVWDATILSAPLLVGEWSSQTPVGIVPSLSSQHDFQIVDGRLYVAHYRCGFWIFDLRTLPSLPILSLLSPVAHYAPQVASGQHWDVVLRNGWIYTSDMRMQQGGAFYVVQYASIAQGDPAQTSTG